MGRACRMPVVVPLSNSWCFQICYTLKHGFSIVLLIKDLGFSSGYKLPRPKNPPGLHFIKEQYWVWSNKCYQGSVLMHFKNMVRDNNSSIPLTEIQGRSKTASHFESTAPITQWALEKEALSSAQRFTMGRYSDNLDRPLEAAVVWKSQLLRQFASVSDKAARKKNPQIFTAAKPKKPTHPQTICFIWI